VDAKAIMEAIVMLAAISIVLVYLPGMVYQATSAAPQVPSTGNLSQPQSPLYAAQGNTSANIAGSLTTVSVTPQLLAIVILLSVIMMLVHRGKSKD
jgi:hypothetical protein